VSACDLNAHEHNVATISLPWNANSSSVSQEIPCTLCNPKVHYHVNNTPPLTPIVSQMYPVHAIPTYLFKFHFRIMLPSISFLQVSQTKLRVFFFPTRATCLTHLILLHLMTIMISGK